MQEKMEINRILNELRKIKIRCKEIKFDPDLEDELDELLIKRRKLQLQRLDLEAKINDNYIKDKELRDYIYDYTNGNYRDATTYTELINNGKTKKEAFEYVRIYGNSNSDDLLKEEIKKIEKLQNMIIAQPYKDDTLIRFEKTQMDENLNDKQRQYKIGEILNWGIRSSSTNINYFEKISSGNDAIVLEPLMAAYPFTYTEFKIVGSQYLDISKYSEYPDQKEALIQGKFKVINVENFRSNIVYDETKLTFKEYLRKYNYRYEERITKSGKDFITIYDINNKRIYDYSKLHFIESIENYLSLKNKPTFEDILNGKVIYKIERKENKEKSTYGIARQIVTIKQILDKEN